VIHIIIGGALSGKTTYVYKKFIEGNYSIVKHLEDVPCTLPYNHIKKTIVIGDYLRKIRCCGVDQLGRDAKRVHEKVLNVIGVYGYKEDTLVVAEGTLLHRDAFMRNLVGAPLKLFYLAQPGEVIQERVKALKIKWTGIVTMTHRQARDCFMKWNKEFEYEIIDQHPIA